MQSPKIVPRYKIVGQGQFYYFYYTISYCTTIQQTWLFITLYEAVYRERFPAQPTVNNNNSKPTFLQGDFLMTMPGCGCMKITTRWVAIMTSWDLTATYDNHLATLYKSVSFITCTKYPTNLLKTYYQLISWVNLNIVNSMSYYNQENICIIIMSQNPHWIYDYSCIYTTHI